MYKALIGNIRRAKDLGKEEAYKEVLEWLDENFYEHEDTPYQCPVICDFDNKEQMLQLFKERFNI